MTQRPALRIVRWDELGAPEEGVPAPAARFDTHPEPADDAPATVAAWEDVGVSPDAPVAEFDDADDANDAASPAPVAAFGDDATPGPSRQPALLIVQPEPGPVAPDYSPDDQQRRRDGRRPPGPRQIDPDADPVAVAREICLRLLTDRARTRQELAQALRRRGVPDDAAGSVLERFDEVGLIDDAAFAAQFVRSRHRHRGLARRAIAMELRRKGVDGEVAEEALGEVDADSESRRARELVDRKLRSLTVSSPEQRTVAARQLVGMLARKGYGAGTAYGVVREALAAHGAEPDELATDLPED